MFVLFMFEVVGSVGLTITCGTRTEEDAGTGGARTEEQDTRLGSTGTSRTEEYAGTDGARTEERET